MKKWGRVLVIVIMAALLTATLSCTSDKTATNTSPIQLLETRIAALETSVATLSANQNNVTKAQIDSINAQIATINSNIQNLQSTSPNVKIAQLQADIEALQDLYSDISQINSKINALQSDVAAIQPVDISGLQASISTLQSSVSALQTQIAANNAAIADLKARVAALEATPPPTTTTTPPSTLTAADAITFDVQFLSNMLPSMDLSALSDTYYIAMTYTNTANKQFTNVKFQFSILLAGVNFTDDEPTAIEFNLYTIPKTALTVWTRTKAATNVYTFSNFQGMTINANESATILLELTITPDAGNISLALAKVL